ncbi:MAG TPA: hypothetical protein VHW66_23115 [Stellaceae bacterium]|jgi:hypothetical protein|nr:hypothetical protein [Stellaceae bacterium]
MTPNDIAAAGRALYGERWQTSVARDLHVSDRTVRRWLTGEFAIPAEAERGIRSAVEDRLETLGGILKFSINARERTIFHFGTCACFRHDNGEELVALSRGFAAPEDMPLITEGAKEALRRERERDPRIKAGWLSRDSRRTSAGLVYGFMRGTVVIPPDIDLTEPAETEPFDAEDGVLHR